MQSYHNSKDSQINLYGSTTQHEYPGYIPQDLN